VRRERRLHGLLDPENRRTHGRELALKFDDKGLITAVVVDDATDEVLMVAWMNDEAVKQTLATRKATFYSRSRRKMWVKARSPATCRR